MESAIPHDNSTDPGSGSASSVVAGYGLAIAAVAVALALILFIRYASGNPTFFSFYIAIFVSVWFGGRGPGWLATALAIVAVHSLFRGTGDLLAVTGEKLPTVLAFIITMVAADILSTQRHRAEQALRSARPSGDHGTGSNGRAQTSERCPVGGDCGARARRGRGSGERGAMAPTF